MLRSRPALRGIPRPRSLFLLHLKHIIINKRGSTIYHIPIYKAKTSSSNRIDRKYTCIHFRNCCCCCCCCWFPCGGSPSGCSCSRCSCGGGSGGCGGRLRPPSHGSGRLLSPARPRCWSLRCVIVLMATVMMFGSTDDRACNRRSFYLSSQSI